MKNLVIVESPAKAKTLGRFLGKEFSLKASLGHIRDLPKSRLGIDVEHDFTPKYSVPREKAKLVKELREAVKKASTIFLATDPDREGEAISWHLAEVTRSDDNKTYKRVVFHEITKEAIEQAFAHPRDLDTQLVNAQQARRILDRLVGYKISPLLWKNVKRGLSAGRVQSVAVKIIVDREREIEGFKPVEYWSMEADLAKKPAKKAASFRANLVGLKDEKIEIHTEVEAAKVKSDLEKAAYSVVKVQTKKVNRQPAPPFITSTMQQEAWRKLHFTAKQTMVIAQQLYEGLPIGNEGNVGLITYMRTDSTNVARQAIAETRDFITEKYGAEYVPAHARTFVRSARFIQEAHEAIRPTSTRREPSVVKQYLNSAQFKLYQLIWQRMVASQMAAMVSEVLTVDIEAKTRGKKSYLLRASSSVVRFPGFTALYLEGRDDSGEDNVKNKLPELAKGDELDLLGIFPEQHFTEPPPRFTEATLIKILEQNGIGRPSTYAPTISTIKERGYTATTGGVFRPTDLGFLVNDLLIKHFPDIVNIEFTAKMENELDEVANENRDWVSVIQGFYTPFSRDLEQASELMENVKPADEPTGEMCPQCGKPIVKKEGRFGKFLACSGYPECKYTQSIQTKIGVKCPECGSEIVQRMSKKRRVFFGCSAYPKCTFATSSRPLTQPCPQCGGLLTQFRKNMAKCLKCEYKGKSEEAEAGKEKEEQKV